MGGRQRLRLQLAKRGAIATKPCVSVSKCNEAARSAGNASVVKAWPEPFVLQGFKRQLSSHRRLEKLIALHEHAIVTRMKRHVIAALLLLSGMVFGQAPPKTMTKLIVRLESPDVPKDSFASLPKTMYRAGAGYCRIEELPDPEHGIHGLIIINEPDIWLVNQFDKTARHQVDPGPSFNCLMPIFPDTQKPESIMEKKDPLAELEFGRELAYFRGRNATSALGPRLHEKETKAYILTIGDSQLFLFTSGTPERPVAIRREHGLKHETYWYGSYEELQFDPKLFMKPEAKIVEID